MHWGGMRGFLEREVQPCPQKDTTTPFVIVSKPSHRDLNKAEEMHSPCTELNLTKLIHTNFQN